MTLDRRATGCKDLFPYLETYVHDEAFVTNTAAWLLAQVLLVPDGRREFNALLAGRHRSSHHAPAEDIRRLARGQDAEPSVAGVTGSAPKDDLLDWLATVQRQKRRQAKTVSAVCRLLITWDEVMAPLWGNGLEGSQARAYMRIEHALQGLLDAVMLEALRPLPPVGQGKAGQGPAERGG